ncbi:hypothetical protein AVEN_65377-1 [Araneus ventricosus]|uniref:Reverse transcriptase zinc-binding domain-containing protein n=1 Tax=Araneus ventricosus TaxID=182803 RepID=A0A4Y2I2S5_ARAVE|nr:hypothetical protein AVEN_65377-1 [Araneus ventricosus]
MDGETWNYADLVLGHRGIAPNEAADQLGNPVNENSEKWQIIAAEDLIVAIRKKYNGKKENCWKTCKYFQDFKHLDTVKKKHKLMIKTRKGDVLLRKFLTNMLPTNKLLHRFNIVSSPNCEFCVHAEETISHILFHCPRYRDPRLQLLKDQDLNPIYSDTSSFQTLLYLDKNAKIKLRALEKFFLSCNRF